MFKIKIFVSFFFMFFFFNPTEAQSVKKRKIDSLFVLYKMTHQDTIKIDLLNKIVYLSKNSNMELWHKYNSQLYALDKKNNYQKGVGYYYFNEAEQEALKGNIDAALLKVTKSTEIFLRIKSTKDFALAQYYRANLLLMLNRGDEGCTIVSKNLILIRNSDHYKELSYLYFFYGLYYGVKDDVPHSLVYLKKAISYAGKAKFSSILLNSYDRIVYIYSDNQQWELALQYSKLEQETLKDFEATEGEVSPIAKAMVFSKMGNIYLHFANYNKALTLANRGLEYAKLSKNKQVISNCLNLISLIHFELKNYQKSIAISQIVLQDYSINDYFALQVLGKNYFMLGRYSKSLTYLKKSLLNHSDSDNAALIEYYLDKHSIYEDLSRTEFALINYKSASEFKKKYYDYKNNSLKSENKQRINELEAAFNAKIKDLAIKNKQIALALSQEKYKTNIICLFCLVILIFLSIAICFLLKTKKHTKIIVLNNIELKNSRALIEESLKRKEVLLKEIHHRVRNNFQIIISLFNIQARQDKGISVKDFLEKGEARIAAMALVHENLYQTNDLEKVKLQEYFENLIQNLLRLFGTNHLTVSIHTENIFLDIKTSVSLGLIVNELMFNAIKYAFPESREGSITIHIKQINEGNYQLFFEDDGVGVNSLKKSKNSLGLTLVGLLVQQIEGTISSKSVAGTAYEINFKDSAIS